MRCLRSCVLFLWAVSLQVSLWAQPYYRLRIPDQQALRRFFTYHEGIWPVVSAHRGGSFDGYPENCLQTFDYLLQQTHAIIECDIAMTRDSVLVLMHDDLIDRTSTGEGRVGSFTWDELSRFRLEDARGEATAWRIPLLTETLAWAQGKTVLMLDVKRSTPLERVVQAVETADAEAWCVIIVYKMEDALRVHRLNPSLLVSVNIQDQGALDHYLASGFPDSCAVAFTGVKLADTDLFKALQQRGMRSILGTMGNLDQKALTRGAELVFIDLLRQGPDILSTDYPIVLGKVIRESFTLSDEDKPFFLFPE